MKTTFCIQVEVSVIEVSGAGSKPFCSARYSPVTIRALSVAATNPARGRTSVAAETITMEYITISGRLMPPVSASTAVVIARMLSAVKMVASRTYPRVSKYRKNRKSALVAITNPSTSHGSGRNSNGIAIRKFPKMNVSRMMFRKPAWRVFSGSSKIGGLRRCLILVNIAYSSSCCAGWLPMRISTSARSSTERNSLTAVFSTVSISSVARIRAETSPITRSVSARNWVSS